MKDMNDMPFRKYIKLFWDIFLLNDLSVTFKHFTVYNSDFFFYWLKPERDNLFFLKAFKILLGFQNQINQKLRSARFSAKFCWNGMSNESYWNINLNKKKKRFIQNLSRFIVFFNVPVNGRQ